MWLFRKPVRHEFILTSLHQHARDEHINTMTLAKRMMDYGVHPPTVYFPLIVPEAMTIEPTETESKQTLDRFIEVLQQIDQETQTQPEMVIDAPHSTPVKRVNEVLAARSPNLNFYKPSQQRTKPVQDNPNNCGPGGCF